MKLDNTTEYLYGLQKFGIKLGLDNISRIMSTLGNPEKKLKIIHIAGTNGKGSCCAMIDSILQQAGYKVGRYTSPHLVKFNERITINNINITDAELISITKKIRESISKEIIPTFFEFTTAMAFLYFKKENVDFAIMEVGLGGRYDATNITIPLVSIITSISKDHTIHLGKTIKKIAREKAGIIKEKIPVITSTKGTALKVIKDICIKNKSALTIAKKTDSRNYQPPLQGDYQKLNTAIVIKTIEILDLDIDKSTIKQGLKNTKWPGRLEFIENNLLLDCAHNPESFKELEKFITQKSSKFKKINLILGILKDKDYKRMIKEISPILDLVIITEPKDKNALKAELIEKEIKKYKIPFRITKNIRDAIKQGRKITTNKDLLVISGSIYLLGEAIQELRP